MPQPIDDRSDALSRSLSSDDLPDPKRSLELLDLARGGDDAAFEELIRRYQDRLRRIVRIQLGTSILRRDYDSMDIVQSTFHSALPKIRDLCPDSAAGLLQWLSLIATNKIRDAYDRLTSEKRDIARERPIDVGRNCEALQLDAGERAPLDQTMLAEIREALDEEVSRLPQDQQRVVLLRDYCGEQWNRIAGELHRDVGAARQLHQRAWIRLRRVLRPRLEGRANS
jgi:RNA polymerase sigma-70 factor (ECF subfamily)